jgi:UDP-N-acetylmuramate--alanine ligase
MVYLGSTKLIHFVGIGGIGMSGIAEVLLNLGFEVSGSDLQTGELTDRLASLGARIATGHAEENIEGADVVVYSSAVNQTNIELIAAARRGIPIIPRAEMLAELMRLKYAVTIAGSHGKTSTTSLVASVLASGGLDPTVVVGGKLKAIRSNARLGDSRYIVAEADESDGGFLQLPSTIAVITNIDLEHLDFYKDLEAVKDSFIQYANRVPFYGSVILCLDDDNVRDVIPRIKRRKTTYSLERPADLTAAVTRRGPAGSVFVVSTGGGPAVEMSLRTPGDHHVRNALAAVAVGLEMDIPMSAIKQGVEMFEGVGRRFEVKGSVGDVMVVDDYGHHPTEIAATIRAAVQNFGRRLIVLFQPHRYSRTQASAEAFGNCFEGAYRVYMTDIYPAGERPIKGVTAQTIIDQVVKQGRTEVQYLSSMEELVAAAVRTAEPGDMIMTLGAGDIYKVGALLLRRLEEKFGEVGDEA